MTEKIKVLGAGSALLDMLARVPEDFLREADAGEKGGMVLQTPEKFQSLVEKVRAAGFSPVRVPGGSSANILTGLSRMGIPNALLAKTGRDESGAFYRACCEKDGLDIRSMKTDPGLPTGICLSLVTPDGQRTMRTCLGASGTLSAEDVTESDFEGITHLHLEGYLLPSGPLFGKLLSMAGARGCSVSLDLSSFEIVRAFRPHLRTLIHDYVDLVFCNEDEAAAFSGDSSRPEKTLAILASLARTAVVTLGKRGAICQTGDIVTRVEAGEGGAIDTTGAGDSWQSGFLYGWLRGKPDSLSVLFASAAAAETVRVTGARIPEDRWPGLLDLFAKMEQNDDNRNGEEA